MNPQEESQSHKYFLLIDSAQDKPFVSLICDQKEIGRVNSPDDKNLSDALLVSIEELLGKNQILKSSLTGIVVNPGPGSFTGLRIGVTAANLLAYSLNIPVTNSLEPELKTKNFTSPVNPVYNKPPHITQSKYRPV